LCLPTVQRAIWPARGASVDTLLCLTAAALCLTAAAFVSPRRRAGGGPTLLGPTARKWSTKMGLLRYLGLHTAPPPYSSKFGAGSAAGRVFHLGLLKTGLFPSLRSVRATRRSSALSVGILDCRSKLGSLSNCYVVF
jgi:hypothetical protein